MYLIVSRLSDSYRLLPFGISQVTGFIASELFNYYPQFFKPNRYVGKAKRWRFFLDFWTAAVVATSLFHNTKRMTLILPLAFRCFYAA